LAHQQLIRLEVLQEFLQQQQMLPQQQRQQQQQHQSRGNDDTLLQALSERIQSDRTAAARERRALCRFQVAERLAVGYCVEAAAALKGRMWLAAQQRCSARLQQLWSSSSGANGGGSSGSSGSRNGAKSNGCNGSTAGQSVHNLELCIVAPPDAVRNSGHPRTTGGSSRGMAAGGVSHVQVFQRSHCPCRRVAAVGATMGFHGLSLEGGAEHWSVRGLRQAAQALQKLPLESAVHGPDPLRIAEAVQAVLDAAVNHAAVRFGLGQPRLEPTSFGSTGFSPSPTDEMQQAIEVDELRCMQDILTRRLFTQLHRRLFPQSPTSKDQHISVCMAKMAWLEPKHLDVPAALANTVHAKRAVSTLRRLHELQSPADMLAMMAYAWRGITEAACLRAQLLGQAAVPSNESFEGGSGVQRLSTCSDAFGADEATPLFILAVLRARPPMFSSVLAYAENFAGRSQMLTEQGYALAQAQSAMSFAENPRPDQISNLEPGEWERRTAAAAAGE